MNGQIGTMMWLMPGDMNLYHMTLDLDEYPDPIECTISMECFGQAVYTNYEKTKERTKQSKYALRKGYGNINYFDFGYCVSVHKSQGSEWDRSSYLNNEQNIGMMNIILVGYIQQ
jgi:hypothetical protein